MSQSSQSSQSSLENEPICQKEERSSFFPSMPVFANIVENYRTQMSSFWVDTKINFEKDKSTFKHLENNRPKIAKATKNVLAFFAGSDDIVEDIISMSCLKRIKNKEIRVIYNFEAMMEDIHSNTYNANICAIIDDPVERDTLLNVAEHHPCVRAKEEFAKRFITNDNLGETIVGKAATEGILFSSSFAYIDWMKFDGIELDGTFEANEEISRDEARHCETSYQIYKHLVNRPTAQRVKEILDLAEEVELSFVRETVGDINEALMNYDNMRKHVVCAKYNVAVGLGYPDLYNQQLSPFPFMTKRTLTNKTNFFEKRSNEYTKLEVPNDFIARANQDIANIDANIK